MCKLPAKGYLWSSTLARQLSCCHVAMGQNPAPPVNIPIPTKLTKMGGEFTYPQNGTKTGLTHSHLGSSLVAMSKSHLLRGLCPDCEFQASSGNGVLDTGCLGSLQTWAPWSPLGTRQRLPLCFGGGLAGKPTHPAPKKTLATGN